MGAFSVWHWLIILLVVLLLFGGGRKLSRLMGDAARGITAFRKGLSEEAKTDDQPERPAPDALGPRAESVAAETAKKDEAAKS